jgi:hypothetical protein
MSWNYINLRISGSKWANGYNSVTYFIEVAINYNEKIAIKKSVLFILNLYFFKDN